MDLREFANLMQRRSRDLPKHVNSVKQAVATEVLSSLAEDTPVRVGTAVSNWQVGIDQAEIAVREAYAPGTLGSTASENVRATIAAGSTVIATARYGQVIHIGNPLPYIKRLNDGWSAQAPAGFIYKAVAKAAAIIKRAKVIKE